MGETALQSPVEDAIDEVLRQTVFRMTPALLQALIYDIARKMIPPEVIAERYGFPTAQVLFEAIAASEVLRERIKAERAVWYSEMNLEQRVRHQHLLILHETAHENGKVLLDPSITVAQRADMFKEIAVVAGVHGMPGGGGRGMEGAVEGPRWTIQMVFPNAGKVEEITLRQAPNPPTIEGESES